ncbi:RtcB family protein [Dongia sp. agr-C8]
MSAQYDYLKTDGKPIKAWTKGVLIEDAARRQVENVARLPFIYKHVAVMPDVHFGRGATVGSVIPTKGAIIPAAVGVDIGCGMCAVKTSLTSHDLPETLKPLRSAIEKAVPVGFGDYGDHVPKASEKAWFQRLKQRYDLLQQKYPAVSTKNSPARQLGTLGGGNHFIEVCLDETDAVWVMLHSGSRGVGNRIGQHFIAAAKAEMERLFISLPDRDLAYLAEGSVLFADYVDAVSWAQGYAHLNRAVMLERVLEVMKASFKDFATSDVAVNCHHNYIAQEVHFGDKVWVTRKGAVSAQSGELGIIPGSMGAKSFIVRGKGNAESFCSCSHGAGRKMSRGAAKEHFSLADHAEATAHVECRKDTGVIDETPGAYKDIDAVMAAQSDLVEIVATLRQVVCVKG